jgi:2-polyprenyl-3-methyl-5-hydroxy-6-metoxy-1,4-benzoquinol methylase
MYDYLLPEKSFDLVFCIETLEHLINPYMTLYELMRICSGSVVVTVPNGDSDTSTSHRHRWSIGEFGNILIKYDSNAKLRYIMGNKYIMGVIHSGNGSDIR